jgi:hypothetical protein
MLDCDRGSVSWLNLTRIVFGFIFFAAAARQKWSGLGESKCGMIRFSLCNARVGGCIFGRGELKGYVFVPEGLSAFYAIFVFRAWLEKVSRIGIWFLYDEYFAMRERISRYDNEGRRKRTLKTQYGGHFQPPPFQNARNPYRDWNQETKSSHGSLPKSSKTLETLIGIETGNFSSTIHVL